MKKLFLVSGLIVLSTTSLAQSWNLRPYKIQKSYDQCIEEFQKLEKKYAGQGRLDLDQLKTIEIVSDQIRILTGHFEFKNIENLLNEFRDITKEKIAEAKAKHSGASNLEIEQLIKKDLKKIYRENFYERIEETINRLVKGLESGSNRKFDFYVESPFIRGFIDSILIYGQFHEFAIGQGSVWIEPFDKTSKSKVDINFRYDPVLGSFVFYSFQTYGVRYLRDYYRKTIIKKSNLDTFLSGDRVSLLCKKHWMRWKNENYPGESETDFKGYTFKRVDALKR